MLIQGHSGGREPVCNLLDLQRDLALQIGGGLLATSTRAVEDQRMRSPPLGCQLLKRVAQSKFVRQELSACVLSANMPRSQPAIGPGKDRLQAGAPESMRKRGRGASRLGWFACVG